MKKCPNCHNELPEDTDTCYVCGEDLTEDSDNKRPVEDDKTVHSDVVLIVVSFLIPILGLVFYIFFRTKNRPYANSLLVTTGISVLIYAIVFAYIRLTL